MSLSFKPVQPLLQSGAGKTSRWFSFAGLGIGVLLLLCTIQVYINLQQMLGENAPRKNGMDFISITKTVTNETMGQTEKNVFHQADIDAIKSKPFVEGVAPLLANQFRVQMSAGAIIPFSTDLFLETLENDFIDTIPPNFKWQEGQQTVPIIISSDFLEIYNVFAPGQGLPQVSEATATSIPIFITIYGNGHEQRFSAGVVAFSDRVNSVLVPKTFMDWANKTFGKDNAIAASRLFIKTKDANNPELLAFLDQENYKVNKDRTKFGRSKQELQAIFAGLAVLGALVIGLALMLFSFYLQLMLARSKDSLQLLLTLGYSPAWLSKNMLKQFLPVYVIVTVMALLATELLQYFFYRFSTLGHRQLDWFLHWTVWATALLLILLSMTTNYRMVKKLLYKML